MQSPVHFAVATSAHFAQPPIVLTPGQFHAALGGIIGTNRIYELLRSGRLRHVKIGRRYFIPSSEVTDFILRETVEAVSPAWAA